VRVRVCVRVRVRVRVHVSTYVLVTSGMRVTHMSHREDTQMTS